MAAFTGSSTEIERIVREEALQRVSVTDEAERLLAETYTAGPFGQTSEEER